MRPVNTIHFFYLFIWALKSGFYERITKFSLGSIDLNKVYNIFDARVIAFIKVVISQ